ncbi:hypothetical protein BVRB_9g217300 [Beta vulgaris subsp. vulgaris]|nr:hypothetical protein BVRB_9g217300 [Beta vulgaris subsp. vulgaris]
MVGSKSSEDEGYFHYQALGPANSSVNLYPTFIVSKDYWPMPMQRGKAY